MPRQPCAPPPSRLVQARVASHRLSGRAPAPRAVDRHITRASSQPLFETSIGIISNYVRNCRILLLGYECHLWATWEREKPMANTATRLITLIMLLQRQPNQTAAQLAQRLDVSARTVQRYIA